MFAHGGLDFQESQLPRSCQIRPCARTVVLQKRHEVVFAIQARLKCTNGSLSTIPGGWDAVELRVFAALCHRLGDGAS